MYRWGLFLCCHACYPVVGRVLIWFDYCVVLTGLIGCLEYPFLCCYEFVVEQRESSWHLILEPISGWRWPCEVKVHTHSISVLSGGNLWSGGEKCVVLCLSKWTADYGFVDWSKRIYPRVANGVIVPTQGEFGCTSALVVKPCIP